MDSASPEEPLLMVVQDILSWFRTVKIPRTSVECVCVAPHSGWDNLSESGRWPSCKGGSAARRWAEPEGDFQTARRQGGQGTGTFCLGSGLAVAYSRTARLIEMATPERQTHKRPQIGEGQIWDILSWLLSAHRPGGETGRWGEEP